MNEAANFVSNADFKADAFIYRFEIFSTLKEIVTLWKMHTPPLLQFWKDDQHDTYYTQVISKFVSLGAVSEFSL